VVTLSIYEKVTEYMKVNGDKVNREIQELVEEFTVKKRKRTEEDFKIGFIKILDKVSSDLEIPLTPLMEHSVFRGRLDALYNYIDLEYKVPTAIEERNFYPARKSANQSYIDEVERQITGYCKKNTLKKDSMLGIIFDGEFFIYVQFLNTDWFVSEPEKRNKHSLTKFFIKLFSLQMEKRAVTIQHLQEDFGFESEQAKSCIKAFYNALEGNLEKDKGLSILFEQWKSLFREVSGYSYGTLKLNLKEIKEAYNVNEENTRIDYLIFSIHTYYALLIKLLVVEILYHHKRNKVFQTAFDIRNSESTKRTLEGIESGGRFERLGIKNFLEGDFFGWYLKVWNEEIYSTISNVLNKYENYNYHTLNLDERNSRDLLKKLYNYLLPRTLRHALGEYYSPDWLAQFVYDLLEINGAIDKKVLDPNTGSGTFNVICINEIIKNNPNVSKQELLKIILENVHGFDLNPLAVIAARANYIIALGDLIDSTNEDIEIPIYLCDSMLTVLEQPKKSHSIRKLATRAGIYEIPNIFVEEKKLFLVLDLISLNIERKKEFNNGVWNEILHLIPSINELDYEEIQEIKGLTATLFEQIKELEMKGIRKIWIQIIKNAFAPIFHEKVDFIIGNPPWVNWQTLPEDYRQSIHQHWHNYKIFDFKGLEARLGSAHDDISVLLTYVVMDNFLKDKGKLGFIINQNLLQAYGGGEGFRKFMIKEEIPVKVLQVDDFVNVEPFRSLGASNKTATIIMQKGLRTTYPVQYTKWDKTVKSVIDSDDLLESVMFKIDKTTEVAVPLRENLESNIQSSPWLIADEEEISALKNLVGNSSYTARKGIDTSLNGLYWVEILNQLRGRLEVRTTPENSKKSIPKYQDIIEPDLVYPLVRGKDLKKWYYRTPYSIIVPYEENLKVPLSMEKFEQNYPLTFSYFYQNEHSSKFVELLKTRGIYKKHHTSDTPPHALYNIGYYTAAPYKVIWKALQNKGINACVIGSNESKLIMPDHNNLLVPLENENEAHFLCAVLNSHIVGDFVDAYVSWFKSAHILENIAIPQYDKENKTHEIIAELSKQAHEIARLYYTSEDKALVEQLEQIEMKINSYVLTLLT